MKHAEVHEHVSDDRPRLGEEGAEIRRQYEVIENSCAELRLRKIRHPVDHINELEKNKHYGDESDQIDEVIRFKTEE